MQRYLPSRPTETLLRFSFSDAVISVPLNADATLEDVARKFRVVKLRRQRNPVAVDVILRRAPE